VPWVNRITLRVRITYEEGGRPSAEEEQRLHHSAHEQCFISNSGKSEIVVEALPAGE